MNFITLIVTFFTFLPGSEIPNESVNIRIHDAVERSLPYLRRDGLLWIMDQNCVSCHHVPLMIWSHAEAKRSGVEIDSLSLDSWRNWALEKSLERNSKGLPSGHSNIAGLSKLILGKSNDNLPLKTDSLDSLVKIMLDAQKVDGTWRVGGQMPFLDREIEETKKVNNLWALLALGKSKQNAANHRILCDAILTWIERTDEYETNEPIILGILLADVIENSQHRENLLARLLERQNEDGGWGWFQDGESNPLTTGQALYALLETKSVELKAVYKAQNYLLATQQESGKWRVDTMKMERGDPKISNYWGTAWATIGLLRSLNINRKLR